MKRIRGNIACLLLVGLSCLLNQSCSKDEPDPCIKITWYQDADGDGLGNPNVTFDSCEAPDGYVDNADDVDDNLTGDPILITSIFTEFSRISDFELVDCTLQNGTQTKCYKVVYRNVPEAWEPGCPANENEVGGLGIYNGNTNPGLRALDAQLWSDFAADGFDIINDDGTINIQIPEGGPGSGFIEPGNPDLNASCLDGILVEDFELTYLIPAVPELSATTTRIDRMGFWGISLDGFPLGPEPPAAVGMGGNGAAIPSLGACGGHPQPAGPFHYHLVPQEVNNLLEEHNVTSVTCDYIAQSSTSLLGYAIDGFPIYGSLETDGSEPTGLDECRG
ncbi:MAG: YHYH protein, partial [Bacteroidota bacterium]